MLKCNMSYSDMQKAEALILLAFNKYDYHKTSETLDISIKSLRRWDKNAPKKGVAELLEESVKYLLSNIPTDFKGGDWAIAVGILLDKWLLYQGKATSRTETIFNWLESLPDDELDDLVEQFTEAASRPGADKS